MIKRLFIVCNSDPKFAANFQNSDVFFGISTILNEFLRKISTSSRLFRSVRTDLIHTASSVTSSSVTGWAAFTDVRNGWRELSPGFFDRAEVAPLRSAQIAERSAASEQEREVNEHPLIRQRYTLVTITVGTGPL